MHSLQLIEFAKINHRCFLPVLGRICIYSLGLLAITYVSNGFFRDIHTANLSMFFLYSTCVELLWACAHKGARFWGCVACALGIWIAGYGLMHNAMQVKATCEMRHSQGDK